MSCCCDPFAAQRSHARNVKHFDMARKAESYSSSVYLTKWTSVPIEILCSYMLCSLEIVTSLMILAAQRKSKGLRAFAQSLLTAGLAAFTATCWRG